MPTQMHHIGIEVSDLARSEAFYVELLGFRKVREHHFVDTDRALVFLELGGVCVELLGGGEHTPYAEAPDNQSGYKHLALLTEDVDGDVARVQAAGYTVRLAPTDIPLVSARIAFVEDPDGIPIELWQSH